jgi:hypothetical protein
MAISFGHNGHRRAISQKFKKLAGIVQNLQFVWDLIYINIIIIINSIKVCYLQYDVSRFCCG